MTDGQLGSRAGKPRLNAKKRRGFRDAAPDRLGVAAEAFQSERQFMPDFVGHGLVFRILRDESDGRRLHTVVSRIQRRAVEQNLSGSNAVRRQNGFQLAEQRRFSAARRAAEHEECAARNAKCDVFNRRKRLIRIRKRQIDEFKNGDSVVHDACSPPVV